MNSLTTTLNQLGLTNKESALYLAALSLGEAGMSALANKARLKRTSAYIVFISLEQKGLMGSFKMKAGMRFVATPPEVVISKTEQQLHQLKNALPELQALQEKAEGPKITFSQGEEGYKVATEESLRYPGSTICHIGSIAEIQRVVSPAYDVDHYLPQRIKNGIRLKALYFKSDFTPSMLQHEDQRELREIRFLPEEYKHNTSLLIYSNKVAFFSTTKELATVIIESAALSESERKKFDLLWSLTPPKADPISLVTE